jgi:Domain of unknown function (DUF4470)
MEEAPVVPLACANWKASGVICSSSGRFACGHCRLVAVSRPLLAEILSRYQSLISDCTQYCGADCQKVHWLEHKMTCRSPLSKTKWRPQWDVDRRKPAWASSTASRNWHNPFGDQKYLWGNVPAIDILQLNGHEGQSCQQDVRLLYAGKPFPKLQYCMVNGDIASGDLRNVVKTLADLPPTFVGRVSTTINDREFQVVARNAYLLLFALSMQHVGDDLEPLGMQNMAEALIHLWYSAFIPTVVLSRFRAHVMPMVEEVCGRIHNREEDALLGKTWEFPSGATLRMVLKKNEWIALKELLDASRDLSQENARQIRAAVCLAPEREDYRHRWYFKDETPFMRIAKQRFREDGLLLPFGHPRNNFTMPNP